MVVDVLCLKEIQEPVPQRECRRSNISTSHGIVYVLQGRSLHLIHLNRGTVRDLGYQADDFCILLDNQAMISYQEDLYQTLVCLDIIDCVMRFFRVNSDGTESLLDSTTAITTDRTKAFTGTSCRVFAWRRDGSICIAVVLCAPLLVEYMELDVNYVITHRQTIQVVPDDEHFSLTCFRMQLGYCFFWFSNNDLMVFSLWSLTLISRLKLDDILKRVIPSEVFEVESFTVFQDLNTVVVHFQTRGCVVIYLQSAVESCLPTLVSCQNSSTRSKNVLLPWKRELLKYGSWYFEDVLPDITVSQHTAFTNSPQFEGMTHAIPFTSSIIGLLRGFPSSQHLLCMMDTQNGHTEMLAVDPCCILVESLHFPCQYYLVSNNNLSIPLVGMSVGDLMVELLQQGDFDRYEHLASLNKGQGLSGHVRNLETLYYAGTLSSNTLRYILTRVSQDAQLSAMMVSKLTADTIQMVCSVVDVLLLLLDSTNSDRTESPNHDAIVRVVSEFIDILLVDVCSLYSVSQLLADDQVLLLIAKVQLCSRITKQILYPHRIEDCPVDAERLHANSVDCLLSRIQLGQILSIIGSLPLGEGDDCMTCLCCVQRQVLALLCQHGTALSTQGVSKLLHLSGLVTHNILAYIVENSVDPVLQETAATILGTADTSITQQVRTGLALVRSNVSAACPQGCFHQWEVFMELMTAIKPRFLGQLEPHDWLRLSQCCVLADRSISVPLKPCWCLYAGYDNPVPALGETSWNRACCDKAFSKLYLCTHSAYFAVKVLLEQEYDIEGSVSSKLSPHQRCLLLTVQMGRRPDYLCQTVVHHLVQARCCLFLWNFSTVYGLDIVCGGDMPNLLSACFNLGVRSPNSCDACCASLLLTRHPGKDLGQGSGYIASVLCSLDALHTCDTGSLGFNLGSDQTVQDQSFPNDVNPLILLALKSTEARSLNSLEDHNTSLVALLLQYSEIDVRHVDLSRGNVSHLVEAMQRSVGESDNRALMKQLAQHFYNNFGLPLCLGQLFSPAEVGLSSRCWPSVSRPSQVPLMASFAVHERMFSGGHQEALLSAVSFGILRNCASQDQPVTATSVSDLCEYLSVVPRNQPLYSLLWYLMSFRLSLMNGTSAPVAYMKHLFCHDTNFFDLLTIWTLTGESSSSVHAMALTSTCSPKQREFLVATAAFATNRLPTRRVSVPLRSRLYQQLMPTNVPIAPLPCQVCSVDSKLSADTPINNMVQLTADHTLFEILLTSKSNVRSGWIMLLWYALQFDSPLLAVLSSTSSCSSVWTCAMCYLITVIPPSNMKTAMQKKFVADLSSGVFYQSFSASLPVLLLALSEGDDVVVEMVNSSLCTFSPGTGLSKVFSALSDAVTASSQTESTTLLPIESLGSGVEAADWKALDDCVHSILESCLQAGKMGTATALFKLWRTRLTPAAVGVRSASCQLYGLSTAGPILQLDNNQLAPFGSSNASVSTMTMLLTTFGAFPEWKHQLSGIWFESMAHSLKGKLMCFSESVMTAVFQFLAYGADQGLSCQLLSQFEQCLTSWTEKAVFARMKLTYHRNCTSLRGDFLHYAVCALHDGNVVLPWSDGSSDLFSMPTAMSIMLEQFRFVNNLLTAPKSNSTWAVHLNKWAEKYCTMLVEAGLLDYCAQLCLLTGHWCMEAYVAVSFLLRSFGSNISLDGNPDMYPVNNDHKYDFDTVGLYKQLYPVVERVCTILATFKLAADHLQTPLQVMSAVRPEDLIAKLLQSGQFSTVLVTCTKIVSVFAVDNSYLASKLHLVIKRRFLKCIESDSTPLEPRFSAEMQVNFEHFVYGTQERPGRVQLCGLGSLLAEPSILGHLLMKDCVMEEDTSGYTPLTAMLLVYASVFLHLGADTEALSQAVESARRICEFLCRHDHFSAIACLYASMMCYREMHFALDILLEHSRFEVILSKPFGRLPQLGSALLAYLDQSSCANEDMKTMVRLRFSLHRNLAMKNVERINAGLKDCTSTGTEESATKLQELSRLCFQTAALYSQVGCYRTSQHYRDIGRCLDLWVLRRRRPDSLFTSQENLAQFLRVNTSFGESLLVAECYRACDLENWVDPLFKNVIMEGRTRYLNDFLKVYSLTPKVLEQLSQKYQMQTPTPEMTNNFTRLLERASEVTEACRILNKFELSSPLLNECDYLSQDLSRTYS